MNAASQEIVVSMEKSMKEQSTFLLALVEQMILSGKATTFVIFFFCLKPHQGGRQEVV